MGATDAAAVRHLLDTRELTRPNAELAELGELERYERPLPKIDEYDQLLGVTHTVVEVAS